MFMFALMDWLVENLCLRMRIYTNQKLPLPSRIWFWLVQRLCVRTIWNQSKGNQLPVISTEDLGGLTQKPTYEFLCWTAGFRKILSPWSKTLLSPKSLFPSWILNQAWIFFNGMHTIQQAKSTITIKRITTILPPPLYAESPIAASAQPPKQYKTTTYKSPTKWPQQEESRKKYPQSANQIQPPVSSPR